MKCFRQRYITQQVESSPRDMVGGSPQGTLLGGLEYNIANDGCSRKSASDSDRFKYFDDLHILKFIILGDLLKAYNFKDHIASDIPIDHLFLPLQDYSMQKKLDAFQAELKIT